jgi:hypothetical protein
MHILLGLLGIAGAIAIWWYRFRYLGQAAGEAIEAIDRVRGDFKRKKLRRQAALSPVTAIDDPVVAAATILVSIHSDDVALSPTTETAILTGLREIATPAAAEEAMIYAKWAVSQVEDASIVIGHAGSFLASRLTAEEKRQLMDLADGIEGKAGCAPRLLTVRTRRLRQKLGLQVA